ncbi:MAG: sigma-70 family RNA polymerase sigma factor [Planctomycetes bacterium]|nr:sigma-70 family RNA polymerase sigma factor [Planctomycetota bacterium]MBI3846927.1 sigma-70 family RNA polymerase sigma factor [Planctomycetota bacterium]
MSGSDDDRHSLERVLTAVRRGDHDEFDRLMGAYRPFLADVVRNGMDARLRSVLEPEDVMQDVMLAAYRGIADADFRSASAFRGWLETLARNRLVDLFRRHFKTQRRVSNAVSLDETIAGSGGAHRGDAIAANGPGPTTIVSRREAAEALEAVLAHCRPKDRELIRLVTVDRLPTREIAARLGKKPEAVRKALARALDACRAAIRRSSSRNGRDPR